MPLSVKLSLFIFDDFPQTCFSGKTGGGLREWKPLWEKGFDKRGIKLYKKVELKNGDLRKRGSFPLIHKLFDSPQSE